MTEKMNNCAAAVIFDLDDTLYSRKTPFIRAFEKTFPGIPDEDDLYRAFIRHGYELYECSMQGKMSMEEMYIERIRRTMSRAGVSLTEEEALSFQQAYAWEQEHLRLSPMMEKILTLCLENRIFLGIVSNGQSDHQRKKYYSLGLDRYITPEHFLPTGDIGISKPDPRALLTAQERWQLIPDRTWYVGDSLSHDMVPAAALGWHTLWINRREADPPAPAPVPENGRASGAAPAVQPEKEAFSEEELYDQILSVIRSV